MLWVGSGQKTGPASTSAKTVKTAKLLGSRIRRNVFPAHVHVFCHNLCKCRSSRLRLTRSCASRWMRAYPSLVCFRFSLTLFDVRITTCYRCSSFHCYSTSWPWNAAADRVPTRPVHAGSERDGSGRVLVDCIVRIVGCAQRMLLYTYLICLGRYRRLGQCCSNVNGIVVNYNYLIK